MLNRPVMTTIQAYSYIRMSTNLQSKGDSLRRQAELSRAYAEKHGLRLVPEAELHDIGVSAFRGGNVADGALGDFLKRVDEGVIPRGAYLLVESLDRISRQDILPSTQLLLRIVELGINVVTLQDERRYSKDSVDMQSLMLSIALMSRAHEESLTKSRRVGAAWKTKRNRIEDRKLTSLCPAWLSLTSDKKTFVVDRDRHAVVQRIFEEAEQGMGSYLITKRLNQEGVPPFGRSNLWVQSYVTKILQNRAVIGEFQPHVLVDGKRQPEGDPIRDYFPSVIDEGLFYRVQEARAARATGAGGRRGAGQRNLFTHIAKCGYCGASMRLVNKGQGPKGGIYLKCSSAIAGGDCSKASWRYDEFEQSFLFFAREIDLDGALNAAARSQQNRLYEANHAALVAKRQHEVRRRDRLIDLLGDERQDLDVMRERIAAAQKQIDHLSGEIDALVPPDEERAGDTLAATELLELMALVRSDNMLENRIKLAAHLRSLVKTLRLEAAGDTPRRARIERFLENHRDDYTARILEHIDETSHDYEKWQPRFTVEFADGRVRVVQVRRGEPLNFIQMLIGADGWYGEFGDVKHEWEGPEKAGYFLNETIRDRISCQNKP